MATQKAELLLKGRIRMVVGSRFAEVSNYLTSSVSDDTEIPDECLDPLLERLSHSLERQITKDLFNSRSWSVGDLSLEIFKRQSEFPANPA